jgi:MFS family permease
MNLSYQSNQQRSADPLEGGSKHTKTMSLTRILLLCGAIAGPLFIFTVLIQDYTRPGFDPRLDPLSLLSLGDWGWVQIVNFALAGVLNLLYAVGLWRRLHPGVAGTWGPILIGAYGLGLIVVGIFTTDPTNGFPPGVIAATHPSWHGAIHGLGGLFVFVMLSAALVVFVRLFLAWKERWWAFYCLASAVLILLIFFTGFSNAAFMARTLRLATLIGWMAASLIAIKLLSTPDTPQQTRDH